MRSGARRKGGMDRMLESGKHMTDFPIIVTCEIRMGRKG
jgi:hypothetical protein